MMKSINLKRNVEVSEPDNQTIRITFTLGISGRFIDMTREEAETVKQQLDRCLSKEPINENQMQLPL